MEHHLNLSDKEFIARFENCSMSPEVFTHEAHIRLAWLNIRDKGVEQAVVNVCKHLQKYIAHLGAVEKYNHTLTVAAVRAVHHFMLKKEIETFREFIATHQRLKSNFRELMAQHYTTDIFSSAKAKKEYLEPELSPFD